MAEWPEMATTTRAQAWETYSARRRLVEQSFRSDLCPEAALEDLTQAMDTLVSQVAQRHLRSGLFCILALGGYGRREMFPHSDVDLLLLFRGEDQEAAEEAIKHLLHDLWDLRLDLGHQVWSLEEMTAQGPDLELALSLSDARIVTGSAALGNLLLRDFLPVWHRGETEELRLGIDCLTRQRHENFQNTIFHLEPDLKEGPGGLRDVLAGGWLSKLRGEGQFVPYSQERIDAASSFMKRMRMLVHLVRGRNLNRLTYRLQEKIAPLAGYESEDDRMGVESMMQEYYLNARVIHGCCRYGLVPRRPVDPSTQIHLDGVSSERAGPIILKVFRDSMTRSKPLSDGARMSIARGSSELAASLRRHPQPGSIMELFHPRPGLYRALTEMYELGVLEALFPEFGGIKAKVTRDFYHQYTVDEHSLMAIRNIEELRAGNSGGDARFAALLDEATHPELLTLALLLHDVGKSREGHHADRSTRMAGAALRRLCFPAECIEAVSFLIQQHLSMTRVIFRRDLEDPRVIDRFADRVGDPDRLRLLCLLTYADIKAVGPGVLKDWTKDLLWQLYVSAYRKLTLGFGVDSVEEETPDLLFRDLPGDLDARDFGRFLEGLPLRYVKITPHSEIYEHYRLARGLRTDRPVRLRLTRDLDGYKLCVVTPDRFHLFARIAGVLASFGMNIFRGYAMSNRAGTTLDLFHFTDVRRRFALNPSEKQTFQDLVSRVIRDERSVETYLKGNGRLVNPHFSPARFRPSVYFEDEPTQRYTIMELVAPDAVGLLYTIAERISSLRCNIDLVLINTEGERAVDVFYLSRDGCRLGPDLQQELEAQILQAIG
ncbi:MAG: HD domain-containing protein [Acidobacteriota bacterium]|nr:HD domain-containing protein [Acidobacteriota bacterium]